MAAKRRSRGETRPEKGEGTPARELRGRTLQYQLGRADWAPRRSLSHQRAESHLGYLFFPFACLPCGLGGAFFAGFGFGMGFGWSFSAGFSFGPGFAAAPPLAGIVGSVGAGAAFPFFPFGPGF